MGSGTEPLDQHRTGYLVKVSLMYVLLLVDLAANSIADHVPATDEVGPFAWAGAQAVAQLLNWLVVFLLMFGTYLFQVGLIGVLLREFRAVTYVLPLYFVVWGGHTAYKIVLITGGTKGAALWTDPLFIVLFVAQKLGALLYYIIVIRTTIKMGQPRLYQKAPWVAQYQAHT